MSNDLERNKRTAVLGSGNVVGHRVRLMALRALLPFGDGAVILPPSTVLPHRF